MPIQSHGRGTKPSQHLERSPNKPAPSASSSSTAGQGAPPKLSRAATLRSHWGQPKKSLPAALPSFQDVDGSANFGSVGIAGPLPGAGTTTTTGSGANGVALPVKPRSRASRATDAISKFLNRRTSDNSDNASKPTTPATAEERRFWPRRLTSEKKIVPESIPIASQVVHLDAATEEHAMAVGVPAASQPTGGKSDAVRGPQGVGSTGMEIITVAQARAHKGKPRVSPNTAPSSQASPSASSSPQPFLSGHRIPVSLSASSGSASGTPRVPTPPLEPPFTPQYTLKHFGSELTELEKREVLASGDIFFFSSLDIKTRRREGKIHSTSAAASLATEPPGDGSAASSLSSSATPELFNDGYDDDRGDYLVLAQDHLAFRFEVLHMLGSGSFGQVVCCWDHQRSQQVAVKIIRNRKKYKEQSLVEVQILSQLQHAYHTTGDTSSRHAKQGCEAKLKPKAGGQRTQTARIVKMYEYFVFRNHVCISFELLGINLYEYLKLRFFQGLPMDNIRDIGAQLVATLRLLHTQRVIHCDLKPENILIKPTALSLSNQGASASANSLLLLTPQSATPAHANVRVEEICLIDFGSSCLETTAIFTYIQSRFYRSPEVILGFPYSAAIDMWSLGCILVELHTGYPIFAGENESEQLACIMELLGAPSHDLLMHSRRRKHFFTETSNGSGTNEMTGSGEATNGTGVNANSSEVPVFQPKPFINSRGRRRTPGSRTLTSAVRSEDQQFVEFVRKCFELDPRQRMTPEQAEWDPWLWGSMGMADDEKHEHEYAAGDDAGASRSHSISVSQEVTGL